MKQSRTIAGLKLTHDGALAVLHGNTLTSVIECEKVANGLRHAPLNELDLVADYLTQVGVDLNSVDDWVVDGWFTQGAREESPTMEFHHEPILKVKAHGSVTDISVAAYREHNKVNPLEGCTFDSQLPCVAMRYRSHFHTSGHLASGYCTSPAARDGRMALVLVWDGGVSPRAYVVDPQRRRAVALGPILPLKGSVYALVVARFAPFIPPAGADKETLGRHELEVPGKAMAYAGLGTVDEEFYDFMTQCIKKLSAREPFALLPHALATEIAEGARKQAIKSADALRTWQQLVGDLLEDAIAGCVAENDLEDVPVIVTGGCALNIGWNSRLRDSERLGQVWAPPFPNDSGSALGTACAEMMRQQANWSIDWDVYSGPPLVSDPMPAGWSKSVADPRTVAKLLHDGAIVMILDGKAELGPRALGHRSIVAAATTEAVRDRLNEIKRREWYRPVAPICLEDRASEVFDPGGCDPYMLFQHRVRDAWRHKIPAVTHVDGTARLQTIRRDQDSMLFELLESYAAISGIPVLCNTSANLPGKGFFPSLAAGLSWGGVDYAWSEGYLYHRTSET